MIKYVVEDLSKLVDLKIAQNVKGMGHFDKVEVLQNELRGVAEAVQDFVNELDIGKYPKRRDTLRYNLAKSFVNLHQLLTLHSYHMGSEFQEEVDKVCDEYIRDLGTTEENYDSLEF